jgi:hypothetical protein
LGRGARTATDTELDPSTEDSTATCGYSSGASSRTLSPICATFPAKREVEGG